MKQRIEKDRSRIFYGYVVIGAAFLILTIAWGANRSFAVFLQPMLEETGWSRAGLSGAFTLAMVVMGFGGIFSGKGTDRFGPRVTTIVCGIFLLLGYTLCTVVRTKWQFYLFYGLITGIGLSVTAPLISLVARWFLKKRALMTGILIAGPGLGNMLIPLLFSVVVRAYGWRTSYLLLGVTTFIFIFVGALFLRLDPRELGLRAYGADHDQSPGNVLQSEGLTMQEALRTRQYWLLCCIYFCDFFLMNVVMVHIVIHAQDQGIPLTLAASVLSVASGVCMFSRVIVGGLGDRFGYKPTFMLCLLLSLSGFVLLLFSHGLWTLYIFAAIFGFSLWSAGGLIGPITADLFGLRAHGAIYGSIFLSGTVGGAFGAVVLGYLYDVMGNYDLGFMLCVFINALSITLLSFLKPRPETNLDKDVHVV